MLRSHQRWFSSVYVVSQIFILLQAAGCSAHGFVGSISIDGKRYQGPYPADPAAGSSVIRQVDSISPVKGANNIDLSCGPGASRLYAAEMAEASPGSRIDIAWAGGDGQNWPHNTGPMLTYLASCGSDSCTSFNSTQAKWFKMQQVARKPEKSYEWAQIDIRNRIPATITLPSDLASGGYLLRHEIIALHNAMAEGGAEFYPSCSQIHVSGTGQGKLRSDELVTFPGAYGDDDPGVWTPEVYDNSVAYHYPGPLIASFIGPSSNVDGNTSGGDGSGEGSQEENPEQPPKQRCHIVRPESSLVASLEQQTHLKDVDVDPLILAGRHVRRSGRPNLLPPTVSHKTKGMTMLQALFVVGRWATSGLVNA